MFFTAAIALAAASLAMAQDVTINSASLTQCAQSTLNFAGSGGPYYVAVLHAENPCGSDAIAEYYDVTSQSVDYFANLPAGTNVQLYVADNNSGQEFWGPVMTVGDGDATCIGGVNSATEASTSSSSASTSPTVYVPPNPATTPSGSTYSNSNTGSGNVADDNTFNDTPANAAQDTTGGASTITASTTLLVGAFVAAAALF